MRPDRSPPCSSGLVVGVPPRGFDRWKRTALASRPDRPRLVVADGLELGDMAWVANDVAWTGHPGLSRPGTCETGPGVVVMTPAASTATSHPADAYPARRDGKCVLSAHVQQTLARPSPTTITAISPAHITNHNQTPESCARPNCSRALRTTSSETQPRWRQRRDRRTRRSGCKSTPDGGRSARLHGTQNLAVRARSRRSE